MCTDCSGAVWRRRCVEILPAPPPPARLACRLFAVAGMAQRLQVVAPVASSIAPWNNVVHVSCQYNSAVLFAFSTIRFIAQHRSSYLRPVVTVTTLRSRRPAPISFAVRLTKARTILGRGSAAREGASDWRTPWHASHSALARVATPLPPLASATIQTAESVFPWTRPRSLPIHLLSVATHPEHPPRQLRSGSVIDARHRLPIARAAQAAAHLQPSHKPSVTHAAFLERAAANSTPAACLYRRDVAIACVSFQKLV